MIIVSAFSCRNRSTGLPRSPAQETGYSLTDDELNRAFLRFKDLADKKKELTSLDLASIVNDEIRDVNIRRYELVGMQVEEALPSVDAIVAGLVASATMCALIVQTIYGSPAKSSRLASMVCIYARFYDARCPHLPVFLAGGYRRWQPGPPISRRRR